MNKTNYALCFLNFDELSRNDFLINEAIFGKIDSSLFSRLYTVNLLFSAHPKQPDDFIFNGHLAGNQIWLHEYQLEKWKDLLEPSSITNHQAYPLSSARSFFTGDKIVKVSLPPTNSSTTINKPLYSVQIERANLISSILVQRQNSTNSYLKAQIECSGGWWQSHHEGEGFLIRQLEKSHLNRQKRLVPYYSFFAHDGAAKHAVSYFEKNLIGTATSPTEWLVTHVFTPLAKAALELYWSEGITVEMHQQNILLELDQNDLFTGYFYFRDIDGCRIDCDLRKHKNLSINFNTKNKFEWIIQPEKLKEMKLKIRPDLMDNFLWNGLIEFTFRRYFEDSLIYLANLYLKKINLHHDDRVLFREFEKIINGFLEQQG